MIVPDIYSLELDITYACGFGCHNCNRMTQIAPGTADQNLTLEQVQRMLSESLDCDHRWWRFSVLGGEPTVHPQFRRIMLALVAYQRQVAHKCHIRVATHGHGDKTKAEIRWLTETMPQVQILNSNKRSLVQPGFAAMCVSPEDLDPDWAKSHRFQGCSIARNCGIGFNYAGFYCCPMGGAIDRLRGLNLAIRSVRELTAERLMETYQTFCAKCGHYKPITRNDTTLLSPGWRMALQLYKERPPHLPRY